MNYDELCDTYTLLLRFVIGLEYGFLGRECFDYLEVV
jgi:hypothetical protein